MAWIRRYAFRVLGILTAIQVAAFWLTSLTMSRTNIVCLVISVAGLIVWQYFEHRKPSISLYHCICSQCGFAWACPPDAIPEHCPRCRGVDRPSVEITHAEPVP